MINKIISSNVNNQYTPTNKKEYTSLPKFGSIQDITAKCGKKFVDGGIQLVQKCEKHPMINVAVLDLATAIIPRTLVETFAVPKDDKNYKNKEEKSEHKKHHRLNILAGMEAFRRESSGLIVNCLIPSAIVYGVAKTLMPFVMKPFEKANLAGTWADSSTITKITEYYKNAAGSGDEKLLNAFKNLTYDLSGIDGQEEKSFKALLTKDKISDLKLTQNYKALLTEDLSANQAAARYKETLFKDSPDRIFEKLVAAVHDETNGSKLTKEAYGAVAAKTHITENIKFKGDKNFHSTNLEGIYSNMVKFLRGVVKNNITETDDLLNYAKKANKLVNWKSLGGLALIIPLAISMQPINRWITHKSAGQKGAPLTVDRQYKEPTKEEKAKLFKQKVISISSMIGVGLLSMMKIPTLNMLQFKGKFPSMDQARIIATATFASRMGASEDADDLREATVRDIATFSSFYFLGDFAAKGIATYLEHKNKDKGIKLINTLKPLDKNANSLEKAWHWIKNTSLKSTDELVTVKDRRLRTICQIGNLAFSLIALGVFIPLYNRTITNKKEQERKARELANVNAKTAASSLSSAAAGGTSAGILKASITKNPAFQAFFNS